MITRFLYPAQFHVPEAITQQAVVVDNSQKEEWRAPSNVAQRIASAAIIATQFAGLVVPAPPVPQGGFSDTFQQTTIKPFVDHEFTARKLPLPFAATWQIQPFFDPPPIKPVVQADFTNRAPFFPQAGLVPLGWITPWPDPPLRLAAQYPDYSFKTFGDFYFSPFKYDFFYTGLSRGEIALTGVLSDEDIQKIKERDRAKQAAWEIEDAGKAKLRTQIQDAVDTALGRRKGAEAAAEVLPPAPVPPREETEDEYIARMLAHLQHLQSQFDNSILMQVLREIRQREIDEENDIEQLLLDI